MNTRTHFVYTAYDADGAVLYVGRTGNPTQRFKAHMAGDGDARGWFNPFVVSWRVSGPYHRTVARRLERERIAELRPTWNGHHAASTGGRRAGIKQYLADKGVEFVQHASRSVPDLVAVQRKEPA